MKKLIPFLGLVALCGCSAITGSSTAPDGTKLAITSHRLFWQTENLEATVKDQKGATFTLKASKSSTDAAAIAAFAQGAVQGAIAGAGKP